MQETYLERIKKLKSAQKITNDKLSEMTGIPLGTLSKLLAGINDSPKLANIVAIAQALGCSLDWMINGIPENTNNYTLTDEEIALIEDYRLLDQYGRILGIVYLDKTDINLQMVATGHAHHYSYFDKTPAYSAAESAAKEKKLGLWAADNPINPYEWRRSKRRM